MTFKAFYELGERNGIHIENGKLDEVDSCVECVSLKIGGHVLFWCLILRGKTRGNSFKRCFDLLTGDKLR